MDEVDKKDVGYVDWRPSSTDRARIKKKYIDAGHQFKNWGRKVNAFNESSLFYLYCQRCWGHILYNAATGTESLHSGFEETCKGRDGKPSGRWIELQKTLRKLGVDKLKQT